MSGILIEGIDLPRGNNVLVVDSAGTITKVNRWTGKVEATCPFSVKAIEAGNTRPDPWHTGVPTEDGDYLVKLDVGHNVYPYYVLKWNKKGWYSHYDMDYPACPQHSVLKWQKIEEASNGDGN